jgi:hypothetical protein
MGYFEATMHVGIALKVDSSFNLIIPALILTFINWNFGVSLQYIHPYLLLPTGILRLRRNTYTHTYTLQWHPYGDHFTPCS